MNFWSSRCETCSNHTVSNNCALDHAITVLNILPLSFSCLKLIIAMLIARGKDLFLDCLKGPEFPDIRHCFVFLGWFKSGVWVHHFKPFSSCSVYPYFIYQHVPTVSKRKGMGEENPTYYMPQSIIDGFASTGDFCSKLILELNLDLSISKSKQDPCWVVQGFCIQDNPLCIVRPEIKLCCKSELWRRNLNKKTGKVKYCTA